MPLKKYVNGSWVDSSYRRYETGTDTVTNLPVEILTDGQPVTSWSMKGNTQTSGTPSPQNPVTISGVGEETANLFSMSQTWYKQAQTDVIVIDGNAITITSAYYAYVKIELKANTTYSIKFKSTKSGTRGAVYHDNLTGGNLIKVFYSTFDTFTTGDETLIIILFYSGTGTLSTETISDIMLVEGQYTSQTMPDFVPYGYEISILKGLEALTPIYLSEPLRKIGDVADTINSDGTVTRRIGKCVFQGTENWVKSGVVTNGGYYLSNPFDYEKLLGVTTICTHFECVENGDGFGSLSANQMKLFYRENSNAKELYLVYTPVQTAVLFKSWLESEYEANHPVTVYYIKATPTTETVTVPTITTTGGEVSIDVDTTVKPSELDLTYHGWHEHEPLKRENGAWV